MRILTEKPPMWDDMAKVFDLDKHKPIFCWGRTIYNPFGHLLDKTPQLIAHEEMHSRRQIGEHWLDEGGHNDAKVRLWWRDYLASASFRLEEEIPAHRAEYRHLLRMHSNTRSNRRHYLTETAKRLRDPLYQYNHLFSFVQAKKWLELDETEMKGE
jgi:hypothetical protein